MTRTDGIAYQPALAPIVLGELAGQLLLFVLSVYVAFLYWRKHRSFPLMFVVCATTSIGVFLADHWACQALLKRDSDLSVRAILGTASAAVWIFYMLHSERVKATFLPPPAEPATRGNDAR